MYCSKSIITRHEKKQEYMNHKEEKNQAFETNPELTQMLLADNDFRTFIITALWMLRKLN